MLRTPVALLACAALSTLCALSASAAFAGQVQVTVIDREGKPVADAVVVLAPSAAAAPRAPLPATATIDQRRMQFVPAVSVVAPGAKLTFTNNDSWDHHVRGSAAGAQQFSTAGGFELRMDGKQDGKPAASAETRVDKPGAVLLGCHLHGSMRGHVFVSDSPWAMKTDADGNAVFDGVPDGPAQVRVWQADQLVDLPPQTTQVGAQPAKVQAQLQVVPRRRRAPAA